MQKYRTLLSLAKLSNKLNKLGLNKDAGEIMDLLKLVLEEDGTDVVQEKEEITPSDFIAGAGGLREDGTFDNMNQGFSLEPFFSNPGSLE